MVTQVSPKLLVEISEPGILQTLRLTRPRVVTFVAPTILIITTIISIIVFLLFIVGAGPSQVVCVTGGLCVSLEAELVLP